jgi:hypothetical protein
LSVAAIASATVLAGAPARLSARRDTPQNAAVSIGDNDLGGVGSGPHGPEAGVWVIAEATELPTTIAKIVVTDDPRSAREVNGLRYAAQAADLVADLPAATG